MTPPFFIAISIVGIDISATFSFFTSAVSSSLDVSGVSIVTISSRLRLVPLKSACLIVRTSPSFDVVVKSSRITSSSCPTGQAAASGGADRRRARGRKRTARRRTSDEASVAAKHERISPGVRLPGRGRGAECGRVAAARPRGVPRARECPKTAACRWTGDARLRRDPSAAARAQRKRAAEAALLAAGTPALSAWRTGSSRAPSCGRISCARRRANRGSGSLPS